jgi:hypothetical protein
MTPLQYLTQLQWELDCSKTSMPPSYVPKTKFIQTTANGLTKCVVAWMRIHGHQCERINTTGRYLEGKTITTGFYGVKHTKGKFIPTSGVKGSSDISCTFFGKSLKIEIKYSKDKQSEYQKQYQADIERSGGIYIIVRTFDEFVEWYHKYVNNL